MKFHSPFISVILLVILLMLQLSHFSCEEHALPTHRKQSPPHNPETMKTIKIQIEDMVCYGCAKKIHNALDDCKGVISNDISISQKTVKVIYDASQTDHSKIISTLTHKGYSVKLTL